MKIFDINNRNLVATLGFIACETGLTFSNEENFYAEIEQLYYSLDDVDFQHGFTISPQFKNKLEELYRSRQIELINETSSTIKDEEEAIFIPAPPSETLVAGYRYYAEDYNFDNGIDINSFIAPIKEKNSDVLVVFDTLIPVKIASSIMLCLIYNGIKIEKKYIFDIVLYKVFNALKDILDVDNLVVNNEILNFLTTLPSSINILPNPQGDYFYYELSSANVTYKEIYDFDYTGTNFLGENSCIDVVNSSSSNMIEYPFVIVYDKELSNENGFYFSYTYKLKTTGVEATRTVNLNTGNSGKYLIPIMYKSSSQTFIGYKSFAENNSPIGTKGFARENPSTYYFRYDYIQNYNNLNNFDVYRKLPITFDLDISIFENYSTSSIKVNSSFSADGFLPGGDLLTMDNIINPLIDGVESNNKDYEGLFDTERRIVKNYTNSFETMRTTVISCQVIYELARFIQSKCILKYPLSRMLASPVEKNFPLQRNINHFSSYTFPTSLKVVRDETYSYPLKRELIEEFYVDEKFETNRKINNNLMEKIRGLERIVLGNIEVSYPTKLFLQENIEKSFDINREIIKHRDFYFDSVRYLQEDISEIAPLRRKTLENSECLFDLKRDIFEAEEFLFDLQRSVEKNIEIEYPLVRKKRKNINISFETMRFIAKPTVQRYSTERILLNKAIERYAICRRITKEEAILLSFEALRVILMNDEFMGKIERYVLENYAGDGIETCRAIIEDIEIINDNLKREVLQNVEENYQTKRYITSDTDKYVSKANLVLYTQLLKGEIAEYIDFRIEQEFAKRNL